jgi:hypothetical protein
MVNMSYDGYIPDVHCFKQKRLVLPNRSKAKLPFYWVIGQ